MALVEVDPGASHQHEFNAGNLRRLLGFGLDKVEGPLTILAQTADGADPEIDESTYTLYDARANVPGRTEWRLYYASDLIARAGRPGDLLLLYRVDAQYDQLWAVIARQGTQFERNLRLALALGDTTAIRRFVGVLPAPTASERERQLALALIAPPPTLDTIVATHPLLEESLAARELPTGRQMADAAHEIVGRMNGHALDPDELVHRALEAETALFFAIERAIGQLELNELIASGAHFDEVLRFALSKHQSRKSRRGNSIQYHMERLFTAFGIRFSAQCETEKGSIPDFIIPGCAEYHDPTYPDSGLRMVGCKSKIRERWGQYLTEAKRLALKYHFSVDPGLSDDLIRTMESHGLRLFMPRPVIEENYQGRGVEGNIGTVEELIGELRAVSIGMPKVE
ncbi:MAG: hypothetical protein L0271_23775 [Gemmatimonadetes bacterium]|nr:hypothetical protein [Gemmatimonadota bacterium]